MASIDASPHEAEQTAASLLRTIGAERSPGALAAVADLLEESLAVTPEVGSIHTSLAGCLVQLGRVREATRHLRRALEIDPGASETRCRLAAILVHEGEVPEALSLYLGGVGERASVRLLTEYADLLARLGFAEDAASGYRSALESRGYAPALVNLGIVHARRGEPARAADCFARAAALDPSCSEATLNLGNAYVELGRHEEAEGIFLGVDADEALRGAARLGRSAIAAARGELDRARELRREARLADRSLACRCARSDG